MEQAAVQQFLLQNWQIWLLLTLWVLPWKGFALWKAARNRHLKWFIAILALNTMAILDIFYIFAIARRKEKRDEESGEETED